MPSGLPGCRWRWMGDILRSDRGVGGREGNDVSGGFGVMSL